MKRIALTTLTLLAVATASGEYTVKVPLETNQGGSLPNGSILLGSPSTETQEPTPENWQPYEPAYTAWVNQGEPYGCTNWTPDVATITLGEEFEQTATDCQQDQTRSRQEREQETTTLAIRDIGTPTIENQTITGIDTRESTGTMKTWEIFADERGLSKNWNNLNWGYANLTSLPDAPYPLTTVNELYLHVNNLSSAEGLSNITNIFSLDIRENQLTNVDWLSNLTYAGVISIWNNSTPLTNINGLRNVEIGITIRLDPYSGPKLPANSRFCTLNAESKFYSGMAKKSELCEAQ
ncbi:hypothetical protein [Pseudomonas aeruginosa]|uniref:hypothetical protein n=1 Tax=Pseudomonas aeruginosa TaxID=287 RepID=UPI001F4CF735|nr:hypothetical protein [Pseudomonas aeruginosa]